MAINVIGNNRIAALFSDKSRRPFALAVGLPSFSLNCVQYKQLRPVSP